MRSRFDSRDPRSTAKLPQAGDLRLLVRQCILGWTVAAILGASVLWPTRAIAQEPGTSPEINAPVSGPEPEQQTPLNNAPSNNTPPLNNTPLNNTTRRPSPNRRGMPPNVVRPQPQPTPPHPAHSAPAPLAPAPPATMAPVEAASLLLLPAHRAQVRVSDLGITVQADNSNLSQVLRDISSATGMKVEGLGRDERIFGNYGPGAPRDVLASLLYGAGYNVLMIGEIADGAPRQLILSQRNGASTPVPAAATASMEEDDTEPDPGEGHDIETAPMPSQAVPILQKPNATPGSEVRTPQQLLEQLQRMHQDQPQAPPQPPQE